MSKPKESNVIFGEMYDISPCGFFSSSPDGKIIKANVTFYELTGYNREEIEGKMRWQDLLSAGGKIYHETHVLPLLKMQGYIREINFEFVRKDKKRLPVLVNASFRHFEETDACYHFSVLDISQRKLYEKELLLSKRKAEELVDKLRAMNTELEQFAYIVSHDLQAPLAAVKGYLQLFKMNAESQMSKDDKSMHNMVVENLDKMSALIRDLLQYSKLESKKESFTLVDLNNVWEQTRQTFHLAIKDAGAEINSHPLPVVLGNNIQLQRLFQNLLSNSLKYCGRRRPEIHLNVEKIDGYWNFRFSDNGIGFDQDKAKDIFKFFHRLENTGKISGTGIGLAASRKIVDNHGGAIGVESKTGEGTTVIFTLPVIQNDQQGNIRQD